MFVVNGNFYCCRMDCLILFTYVAGISYIFFPNIDTFIEQSSAFDL